MKYAVIKTGGKQYKVSEGQQIKIEKLPLEAGKEVTFDEVLLTVDGDNVAVGTDKLPVTVTGTIVDQVKDKKVVIFKYKPKGGFHKKTGHRQNLTVVKIETIGEKKGKATTE